MDCCASRAAIPTSFTTSPNTVVVTRVLRVAGAEHTHEGRGRVGTGSGAHGEEGSGWQPCVKVMRKEGRHRHLVRARTKSSFSGTQGGTHACAPTSSGSGATSSVAHSARSG